MSPLREENRWRWIAIFVWITVFTAITLASLYWNRQANSDAAIKKLAEAREAGIYASCVDINQRHDNTTAALDKRTKLLLGAASKADRAVILGSRDYTLSLIDALTPKRDCFAYLEERRRLTTLPSGVP